MPTVSSSKGRKKTYKTYVEAMKILFPNVVIEIDGEKDDLNESKDKEMEELAESILSNF